MTRLRRMDEEGGLAGRGEGRRDLARDMPGFADAGHDDPAGRGRDRLDRFRERGPKSTRGPDRLLERLEALALVGDGAQRRQDGAGLLLNHGLLSTIRGRGWKTPGVRSGTAPPGSDALRGKAQPAQLLLEPGSNVAAVEREGEVGAEKSKL